MAPSYYCVRPIEIVANDVAREARPMAFRSLGFGFCLFAAGCGGVVIDDPSETSEVDAGDETLETSPSDRCAKPQEIDLSNGSASIAGDTSWARDEFPGLDCESKHVAFTFDQGQLYYRFAAEKGRTYSFALTPSFYGFVYAFRERVGCSEPAIQAACSSGGESGMISPIVNPCSTGDSSFTALESDWWVFAVDGDTSPGPFELLITVE
jgi:hypothetical protein